MPNKIDYRPRGPIWWRELADEQGSDKFQIAFSGGKDSIACAIALRDAGYDLYPHAYIEIPGMSFVEETLVYYERTLFGGRHITRVLLPAFCRDLMNGAWQPPQRLPLCAAMADTLSYDDYDVQEALISERGLPEDTYTAIGFRAADNPMRRRIIVINGPVTASKRQFSAIWDWKIDQVIDAITRSGLKLPTDYAIWQHSFQAAGEFFLGVKTHYPDDWRRLLEWFPLAEAEIFRHEMRKRA
jgi:hypothetical protein